MTFSLPTSFLYPCIVCRSILGCIPWRYRSTPFLLRAAYYFLSAQFIKPLTFGIGLRSSTKSHMLWDQSSLGFYGAQSWKIFINNIFAVGSYAFELMQTLFVRISHYSSVNVRDESYVSPKEKYTQLRFILLHQTWYHPHARISNLLLGFRDWFKFFMWATFITCWTSPGFQMRPFPRLIGLWTPRMGRPECQSSIYANAHKATPDYSA